jgi:very-short-patch-repair endonuclease
MSEGEDLMYDAAKPEPAFPNNRLASYLKQARDRLIQTGTRNRLVHTARFVKRGKSIDIVDEHSNDVFRILVTDGKRMRFDHDPTEVDLVDEDEPQLLVASGREKREERFSDNLLQTKFGQDRLQKKLLSLAREAKTLEEEQGINALYLALGFLRWFEDEKSEIEREAPLILVPVSLRRSDRSSTHELEARGEDITTNEPLKHRLADDFGIKLPEIDEGEDWSPNDYFAAVEESISGRARWTVDADGMQLGFFSFAKLLMVHDLESENWPDANILDHPIVAGLLADGFGEEPSDFAEGEKLDEIFTPADLIQVVDADASQTLVIETVRKGRNLVVKGPPGTGKSQTITNIIASAVHDGKSVLFVAEKMAALDVVHSRLVHAGLRDVCLELHSRSANKRLVVQELGRTLGAAGTFLAEDSDATELLRLRDQLNSLSEAMHTPIGETDVTAYRAVSTLVRLREARFAPADYNIAGVEKWSRKRLTEALQAAKGLADITRRAGSKDTHPFFGARRSDLLPTDIERVQLRLSALVASVEETGRTATIIAQSVGLTGPTSPRVADSLSGVLSHISTLSSETAPFATVLASHGGLDKARAIAELGLAIVKTSAEAEARFRPAALSAPVSHLRPMLATGHSFFGRLGRQYRAASAELQSLLLQPPPKAQASRMQLVDELVEWQQLAQRFKQQNSIGEELLGDLWRGRETNFSALLEAVEWIGNLLQLAVGLNAAQAVKLRRYEPDNLRGLGSKVSSGAAQVREGAVEIFTALNLDIQATFGATGPDAVPFDALASKLRLWLDNMYRLDEWSQLLTAHEHLTAIVGDELTGAVAAGRLAPDEITATIRYVHAEALYRLFAADKPWATQVTAHQKTELVGSFREREKRRRATVSRIIRGQHLNQMPRGGMGAMGFIRGEVARKRGHKPIRTVMKTAGTVVQQIKPVLLMSPISVAQYLPPGSLEFDLLVIDEASQVRPEDALGAIARARQIVVVGDRQQLPPTSFFDRIVADEDDEDEEDEGTEPRATPKVTSATELESVLTLCEARGLNTRMLEWHYRSRHPSLIEVSNEQFYEGRLVLFPSPSSGKDTDGLRIHRVNGAYDRGGKRHNVIEAKAVARAVANHAQSFPERTLGVVTFSTAQRDQVTYWLDKLRQDDEALDIFMREGKDEEFFVKNIENVQGDERDVILVSVGYGPRIAGQRLDSMGFGPVSTEGGERRLNVLFTRARFKTEVFVSFDSGDIDLSRTHSEGARVLKHFLHAAETGLVQEPRALDDDPDSDFEVSVAKAIRTLGYEVHHQIGSGGFKIDLAVRDPDRAGRYVLAVECDGATYHSAVWARERDRQRQEVLEGLGWRFHRVWSTDWFHRRSDEFRRLEAAIEAARGPQTSPVEPEPSDLNDEIDQTASAETEPSSLPDYEVADFPILATDEPHLVPVAKMKGIVERIVAIEGPVHQEEIARRVATLFGKQKAGSRIAERVEAALRYLKTRNDEIVSANGFWLTKTQQADMPLRNRSRAPLNLRRANLIPPMEMEAAIERVLEENGALAVEEIPRAVALLFGFQRTGQEFRPAVEPVVESLLSVGKVTKSSAGVALVTEGDVVR